RDRASPAAPRAPAWRADERRRRSRRTRRANARRCCECVRRARLPAWRSPPTGRSELDGARPAAGRAGDEVLRSLGEKLELRPLQRAQPPREGRIGEPLAQQRNRVLVLGTGKARCRSFQARIAEEPMNDLAARLAHLEKV